MEETGTSHFPSRNRVHSPSTERRQMGMTLRIRMYRDGQVVEGDREYSVAFEMAEPVDELCEQIGVMELTNFYDHSDLEAEFAADDEFPETDQAWFTAADGLTTVEAVLASLHDQPVSSLPDEFANDENRETLIDELEHCRNTLREALSETLPFHLRVVM